MERANDVLDLVQTAQHFEKLECVANIGGIGNGGLGKNSLIFTPPCVQYGSLTILRQHTHVTAYPKPNPYPRPNPNCIPSICRTYSKSCKCYTSARGYHVTVAE